MGLLWLWAATLATEASAAWTVGRWHVVTETISQSAPLALAVDRWEFVAPAWQVEAIVNCREGIPPEVRCRIEAASVRVVTYDHWQRPEDRERVQGMLDRLQTRLETIPFVIRNPGPGELQRNIKQRDPNRLALMLLDDVLDAFVLQPAGERFGAGERWQTGPDPLLEIPFDEATGRPDAWVNHQSRADGEWLVVDSASRVQRTVVALPRAKFAYRSTSWRTPARPAPEPIARREALRTSVFDPEMVRPRRGQLTLKAQARLEPAKQRLVERSWTIDGEGATRGWRAGRLRRLERGETIELGTTQQVADPSVPLNFLPPWLPFEERTP